MITHHIVFFVCERMLTTSLSLPIEMLKAAESAARIGNASAPALTIKTAALTSNPVTTRAGFQITPDSSFTDISQCHTLYLPAIWRNPRPILQQHQALYPWLQQLHQQGSTLSAVGTGCCFMAEAGLLDGKAATTHWHYFDQFQRDYPLVKLQRQYFITQAGNLYCSASVNALADLTVHFIQKLYGQTIANHVETHFFHEIRRSYESGYLDGDAQRHPDEQIVRAQNWLRDNFAKDITLTAVAQQFDMSVRTFNRRFKTATQQTPLAYLQTVRLQIAKELLQTSNLSIAEVAYRVGYQDESHFARLFKRHMATSPRNYRTTVRAKLFSAN